MRDKSVNMSWKPEVIKQGGDIGEILKVQPCLLPKLFYSSELEEHLGDLVDISKS